MTIITLLQDDNTDAVYQDVFVLVMVRQFEVAGGREDGLDGSHAIVVVELGGQLLGTQSIGRDDLDGQVACVHEAVRVETDLGDHSVVRHHHRHRTKQNLHQHPSLCHFTMAYPGFQFPRGV